MLKSLTVLLSGLALGAVVGGFAGFGLGFVIAPKAEPGQPLAHEWYPITMFAYAVFSAYGAGFVGTILAAFPRRWAVAGATAGLVLGGLVGVVVWRQTIDPPYCGVSIILFAYGGSVAGIVAAGIFEAMQRAAGQRPRAPGRVD